MVGKDQSTRNFEMFDQIMLDWISCQSWNDCTQIFDGLVNTFDDKPLICE